MDAHARPRPVAATSGEVRSPIVVIIGEGPSTSSHIPGFISNVELGWNIPSRVRALPRARRRSRRLIIFDKRGNGNV